MALLTEDEVIDIAIRLEENGEAFYTQAARDAGDVQLQALFDELARQERQHRRTFQQMSEAPVRLALSADQWAEFQAYVGALLRQSFFAGPEAALNRAAAASEPDAALRAALGFEEEAIRFYQKLHDAVGDSERQVVARVIEEEKQHARRLQEMLAAIP